jgi:SAM-dependent methyltransferase
MRTRERTVARLSREWDELAEDDALFAVLSNDPRHSGGRWRLDEFFATGEREVDEVMREAAALGLPRASKRALDFGCGVGRLSRALAHRFGTVVGVDVSAEMVARAQQLNADRANCTFAVNVAPNLRLFPNASFDVVFSSKVLQHMTSPAMACDYIREFVRVLQPGGLVAFQLWTRVPLLRRVQPRRRAYGVLRSVRVPQPILARMRLSPRGRGVAVSEATVRRVVGEAAAQVVHVHADDSWGLWYYATRR